MKYYKELLTKIDYYEFIFEKNVFFILEFAAFINNIISPK